jgi:hypothetical protein
MFTKFTEQLQNRNIQIYDEFWNINKLFSNPKRILAVWLG